MPVFRFRQDWNIFQDLEREVDRLLNSMSITVQGVRLGRTFPAINCYEYPDHYLLTAELPGMKSGDLDLSIADGRLLLKGERDTIADSATQGFRRMERFRGKWQRSIPLPDRVIEEELSADLNHGVLKITLPKAPENAPRQIAVQEGGE